MTKKVKFLAIALLSAVLAIAAEPIKSRWRSLKSGNLFEVTDYGDRLSIRFLEAETVSDQGTERPDVTAGGPRQTLRPGRWLLQKGSDGRYVGTAESEMNCTYWRQWYLEWRTNVCKFSDPVELTITGAEIAGWHSGAPANKATFDCTKCQYSKVERIELQWAREPASEAATAPASPGNASVAGGTSERAGLRAYTFESQPTGAEVYVDGDFVGSTPLEHTLSAGRHEIELRKKGLPAWKRQLNVSPGPHATISAEMEP